MARGRFAILVVALWSVAASGQQRAPHLGYLYPAGGRQGTVFRVTAGGQYLNGVREAYLEGEGVHVKILEHVRPLNNQQMGDLGRYIAELVKVRLALVSGRVKADEAQWPERPNLPDHPLTRGLEEKNIKDLNDIRLILFDPKRQPNAQISEQVLLEVSINPTAPPGLRWVRLAAAGGLTNPVQFHVGLLPEVSEGGPTVRAVADTPPAHLPAIFNGQIMPGEVDRFRFEAAHGQQLVIEALARRLVPYLADAVPGWFQAVLALYDETGREVAYVDDFTFDPDPVLFYRIPADGSYTIEIRDAIYRGREDFVYRITVGERPFVTHIFPLGGPLGGETTVSLAGWNLPGTEATLDTAAGEEGIRYTALRRRQWRSNLVPYAVDTLPEALEVEPNDDPSKAAAVTLPLIVNGRIDRPGDRDNFWFNGAAGQEVVVEVMARRLNSPLDSVVRLFDEQGALLAWNDDHDDPRSGLLTHHADSYLTAKLPTTRAYRVELADVQSHGGEEYAYRLRLGGPKHDFALRATPASLSLPAGGTGEIWVHAVRRDGFAGDIEVALLDAPEGFQLGGAIIPGQRDKVRVTLTAPPRGLPRPVSLQLKGRARIDGRLVSRFVTPADDMMQAFAYRHLVPTEELMVEVLNNRRNTPPVKLPPDGVVKIPFGGEVAVLINNGNKLADGLKFELSDAPKGFRADVETDDEGLKLVLSVTDDEKLVKVGYRDNLIVEAVSETTAPGPGGRPQFRRWSVGLLPAIPIQVVPAAPTKPDRRAAVPVRVAE